MDRFETGDDSVTKKGSMHWSKEMLTVFQRDLFFLVLKILLSKYTSQMMGGDSRLVPKKTL